MHKPPLTGTAERARQSVSAPKLVGRLDGSSVDDRCEQLENVLKRQVDGLVPARLLSHTRLQCWRLGVRIVVGQDPKRLRVLGHDSPSDLADAVSDLVGRQDPKLAVWQLLDEDGRPWRVADRLELLGDRDDVAVADAADLDYLHAASIYEYIPLYGVFRRPARK